MRAFICLIMYFSQAMFLRGPYGPLRQVPYAKIGFQNHGSYRENVPVKNHGFKTMYFIGIFEEALKGQLLRQLLARPMGGLLSGFSQAIAQAMFLLGTFSQVSLRQLLARPMGAL